MSFVICFDTLCSGYSPVLTSTDEHPEGTPLEFETEEIGHKTIFNRSST